MRFVLNGRRTDLDAPPLKRLLDVLREDCGLAGRRRAAAKASAGRARSSWTARRSTPAWCPSPTYAAGR